MPSIPPIDTTLATGATGESLAAIRKKLGRVPNLFATLAHAPAALGAYLQLSAALEKGAFSAKQRELVALSVAEANGCDYCLAAHTALGSLVGLKGEEIAAARSGRGVNARDEALASLARRIVEERGLLSREEIASFKSRGLSDADLLETIAVVSLNILTNYTNHVAGTEVDFPRVEARQAA